MTRNYVGIAVDPNGLTGEQDDLVSLELEGFREVKLKDAKVTLMLFRWTKDESPGASILRSLINGVAGEEENSD